MPTEKKRSEPSPTAFDGKLDFNVTLLPYEGSDAWIEPILFQIRECLDVPIDDMLTAALTQSNPDCKDCAHRKKIFELESGLR